MLGGMMTYYRAWENRRFVRRLLREKQPELAAALESVVQETPCLLCHGSRFSMPGRLPEFNERDSLLALEAGSTGR